MKLDDIRLADPDLYTHGVPYELFDRLRREDPVHWTQDAKYGVPFWAVTRYHDVVHVSRHPELFSSAERSAMFYEISEEELAQQRLMMLNMDPPQHTRLRSLVNKGFTPRMVARLEDRIRLYANEIVDRAVEMGSGDFVRWISAELPLEVIAELMGAPSEDRNHIFELSNRLIGIDDPDLIHAPEESMQAAIEMWAYGDKIGAEKRKNPADDIATKLVQAEVDGERLSEFEFALFFMLLSVAGNETTRNAISHGMHAFFGHPDQWQRLIADRSLLDTMADEIVRWSHPVMQFRRTAMADTELGGKQIRRGDKVIIYYSSANRDEEVFPEPYTFDIGRDPNPHIGFGGGGPHFCLGTHLAKLEMKVMFDVLADRLPDITLAGDVKRLRSHFINGIKEMPVIFTP